MRNPRKTRFFFSKSMIGDYYQVFVTENIGGKQFLHPLTEPVEIDEMAMHHEPTFRITPDEAQHLIDGLWDAGFRPTEGSGSAGSFAAQGRHLEDMRKLVFREEKGSKE